MKHKSDIAKRIVKGIAALFGVLGAVLVFLGFFFIAAAFRNGMSENAIGFSFMTVFWLVPGALMIYAAYKALFRFSSQALADVTGLCGFILYVIISNYLINHIDAAFDSDEPIFIGLACMFAPVVVGYGFHKLLKTLFMKLIYGDETEKVPQ